MSLGLFVPIISQFKQYFLPAALIVQEVKHSNIFVFEFFFVILGCLNHNGVWVNVVLLEHDDACFSYVLSLFIKDHSVHPFCLLVLQRASPQACRAFERRRFVEALMLLAGLIVAEVGHL